MTYHNNRTVGIILAFVIFGLFHVAPAIAKVPQRVAILPFIINAERDLSFLRDGILDMLSSRLLTKGGIEVVEKQTVEKEMAKFTGPLNRERAILIGNALQTDYVIFGSLTEIGENISIDATVLDVEESEELVTAYKQSKGMDEVIPAVNQLAQEINEKIMGRVTAAPPIAPKAPKAPETPPGLIGDNESAEMKGAPRVMRYNIEILGLDVGDVDGDGKNELVFIDEDTVYIYKWINESFRQWKTIKERWSRKYALVNVADLDRNGNAELYVTDLDGEDNSSLVLEWSGNGFEKISNRQPWFFRVIDIPGRGKTLIGQKREMVGEGFLGDVQFLKREGDRFVPTRPVELPRNGNVFNFAFMDPEGRGKTYTIMFDTRQHLELYDPKGEEIWISEEQFGGTYTYMDTYNEKRIYFSSPIYMTDANEDGEQEVMVCNNHSRTGLIVERVRSFSGGTLYFFTWEQGGLSLKWKTKRQPGPITGYRVADLDNDGLLELVIASVTKQDTMFSKPRSHVEMYDLR